MYKAVVFDFFGVILTDQYSVWLSKHGYKREGGFYDASQASDKDMIDMQTFYGMLSSLSHLPANDIEAEFKQNQNIDMKVVELVKLISKKYKTALLSNSNSDYLKAILEANKLDALFNYIVVSGDIGFTKPSPEIYEFLLKKVDLEPQEVIFIDDNQVNCQGAEDLGIKAIHYKDVISLSQELSRLGLSY